MSLRRSASLAVLPILLACADHGDAQTRSACAASPPPAATTGQLLVASQVGVVSFIDLATGMVTPLDIGGELHGAAVSPDGRWGIVTDYGRRRRTEYPARLFDGNTLLVFDMASGRLSRRITTGEHRGVHDVAFVPGSPSEIVVTAQGSREIILVDLGTGSVRAAIDTRGEGTHSLAIAADGRTVYGANEEEETITRIDMARRELLGHLTIGANPLGVAVTPDGSEVWAGSRDGALHILDASSGTRKSMIRSMGFVDDLTFTPDGRRAIVLDARGGSLRIVDVARRLVTDSVAQRNPGKVALSPDGRVAFVSLYRNRSLAVVDLDAACVVRRFEVPGNPDGVGWSSITRRADP